MLLSAHFFSGVAIFAVASALNSVPKNLTWLSIMVIFSMVPDSDMLVSRLHRNAFTHTPLFWMTIAVFTVGLIDRSAWILIRSNAKLPLNFCCLGVGLIDRSAWILIPTILLHLLLDTLDYGLMVLYPFSRRKFGIALLHRNTVRESDSLASFVTEYLSNRKLVLAELGIMLTTLFLVLVSGHFF